MVGLLRRLADRERGPMAGSLAALAVGDWPRDKEEPPPAGDTEPPPPTIFPGETEPPPPAIFPGDTEPEGGALGWLSSPSPTDDELCVALKSHL